MPDEPTPATSPAKPTEYILTPEQRNAMSALSSQVVGNKMQVYALNVQKEQLQAQIAKSQKEVNEQLATALKAVDDAQNAFNGALYLLSQAHGIERAQITPDLAKLVTAQ